MTIESVDHSSSIDNDGRRVTRTDLSIQMDTLSQYMNYETTRTDRAFGQCFKAFLESQFTAELWNFLDKVQEWKAVRNLNRLSSAAVTHLQSGESAKSIQRNSAKPTEEEIYSVQVPLLLLHKRKSFLAPTGPATTPTSPEFSFTNATNPYNSTTTTTPTTNASNSLLDANHLRAYQVQKILIDQFVRTASIQELNIANSLRDSVIQIHEQAKEFAPTNLFDSIVIEVQEQLSTEKFPAFVKSDTFYTFIQKRQLGIVSHGDDDDFQDDSLVQSPRSDSSTSTTHGTLAVSLKSTRYAIRRMSSRLSSYIFRSGGGTNGATGGETTNDSPRSWLTNNDEYSSSLTSHVPLTERVSLQSFNNQNRLSNAGYPALNQTTHDVSPVSSPRLLLDNSKDNVPSCSSLATPSVNKSHNFQHRLSMNSLQKSYSFDEVGFQMFMNKTEPLKSATSSSTGGSSNSLRLHSSRDDQYLSKPKNEEKKRRTRRLLSIFRRKPTKKASDTASN